MNHFNDLIREVNDTPQAQRPDILLEGICHQLQQSQGQVTTQELGQELQAAKTQLVKAFNNRQQGG